MQKEILHYSAHPDITFWDLKSGDFSKYKIAQSDLNNIKQVFLENKIKAFLMWEDSYHHKFHSIPSKPFIIHYLWDISLLDKKILALVWPRKPSIYSRKVLEHFFQSAKNHNLATISWMADGVDQLAHALSIKHKIPTIAVLGWWINHFLKWSNRHIVQSIVENGWLILSEYKVNFVPTKYSFPQRNRIIAGLSDMVFLPEAWEKSGSLITVDFALQSSKPIYVVPNDIFSKNSFWANSLISQWKAKVLVDFEYFFSDNFQKNWENQSSQKINKDLLSSNQKTIISALWEHGKMSLWSLIQQTSLNQSEIIQQITFLEMNNYIYQHSPGNYSLC